VSDPYAGIARPVQQRSAPQQQDPYAGIARPVPQQQWLDNFAAFNNGLTMGGYDELVAAPVQGGINAAKEVMAGRDAAAGFRSGYQGQINDTAQRLARTRATTGGNLSEGTGAAVPTLAALMASGGNPAAAGVNPGVAAATRALTQQAPRGLLGEAMLAPGLKGQAARGGAGALAGGGSGYVTGFFNSPGGLGDRNRAGSNAGALGTALGVGLPAALGATAWTAKKVGDLASRIQINPNVVSMNGLGGVSIRPPVVPPDANIPAAALNRIEAVASRARMTPDDIASRAAQARQNPQGQTVVDMFGDPGLRTLRPIVQSPGETGQLAQQTARQRFLEAPLRIQKAVREGLKVGVSPQQALQALETEYAAASKANYQPLFARPTRPDEYAMYQQRIEPFMDLPVMKEAEARAARLFQIDRKLGLVEGGINDNLAKHMHYIKMGLDDAIGDAPRSGIQASELRALRELRKRFVNALDAGDGSPAIIPGYAEARARWGGLKEAEEALEEGHKFLRMDPDEVAASMAKMTPFAKQHARIGLAEAIQYATRGAVNRNKNAAIALDDPYIQQTIANAFDSPQQAAVFLDTVNTQQELMTNAVQWGTGSQTFSNVTHGADNAAGALAEAAGNVASGNPGAAARQGGNWLAKLWGGAQNERANNQAGRVFLQRVDVPESQKFTDELVQALRRREAARRAQATNALTGGAAAGQAAGRRKD